MRLQGPKGPPGPVQEVVRRHDLIHNPVAVGCIHGHLLDDIVAEGGKGVEGAQIRRGDIDIVDMVQIHEARGKLESLTIGLMCVMMSFADRRLPGSTVVQ